MPIGNKTDFTIYQDGFQTGMLEALEQEVSVLNAGPRGIIVVTEATRGEFLESAFFQNVDGLVSDRDTTSTADAPETKLTQDQVKDILCNYRVGPNSNTIDGFRKISESPDLMSVLLGEAAGQQLAEKYLNGGLGALVAAMSNEAAMVFDTRGAADAVNPKANGTSVTLRNLNRVLGLMGDKRSRTRMWVMPSAPFTELVDNQITEKLGEVSGAVVYGGNPGTYGLPAYVTDSPALTFTQDVSAAQDGSEEITRHRILGLTEQALVISQQPYFDLEVERKTGKQNLLVTYQGEGAYRVAIKGFSWVGSESPTDGQLATASNWDYKYQSVKSGPGVMLIVDDEPSA
ncbi:major capsid protein [Haliea sp.]|uniref:major capsid protein n=1 Tax=Haliea sp. TaxID=1932666 RepID=UPI0025C1B2C5|nr:major capsid protein [Haliea sp.]|tara:strand:- start:7254 stop:8288 length:1035 start_codon:yes stop_codon:yes gene_type:complete